MIRFETDDQGSGRKTEMENIFEQVEKNIDNLVLNNVDWTASATKEELDAARDALKVGALGQREGMPREMGGGSGWGHMYTHGGFMSMYGKFLILKD